MIPTRAFANWGDALTYAHRRSGHTGYRYIVTWSAMVRRWTVSPVSHPRPVSRKAPAHA